MTFLKLNYCLFFFFFFVTNYGLWAQPNSAHLFSKYDLTYADLAFEQCREVDRIAEDELIVFQQFGFMSDISILQDYGEITLLNPETDEILTLKPRYTEFRENGYSWYGNSTNVLGAQTRAKLYYTKENDFFLGSFQIEDIFYQFEYIGAGLTMIYRLSDEIVEQHVCGIGDAPLEPIVTSGVVINNCDVDIVAMYTKRFRRQMDGWWNNWTGKTEAAIKNEFFRAQTSRILSSLDIDFQFKLVGIEASEFEENIGSDVDKEKEEEFTPSFQSGEMNNMRYQFTADIVVLFTHGKYIQDDFDEDERIGGSAGTTEIDPALAYVILEKRGLNDRRNIGFTLPHEIFHLFSAQHTAQPFSAPYAEFHEIPKSGNPFAVQTFGTLMISGPITGRFHLETLSNPDLSLEEEPLGIAEERDNARAVSEAVCDVSDYRSKLEPQFGVNLFYNDPICLCVENASIQALPYNGSAPFDFQWTFSLDGGFNYSDFGGSSAHEIMPIPCTGDHDQIWIKIVVEDANGNSKTGVSIINLQPASICNDDINRISNNVSELGIRISPNPCSSIVNLDLLVPEYRVGKEMKINFLSLSGRLLKSDNRCIKQAVSYISVNLENFAQGIYIVCIDLDEEKCFKKFVKL